MSETLVTINLENIITIGVIAWLFMIALGVIFQFVQQFPRRG